jgi:hypothetical protein
MHALASLNFSRNQCARRLPLAKRLLYFAFSAPINIFTYKCWIDNMPSYSAIYNTMRSLAEQEAATTKAHRRNPTRWGII